MADIIGTVFFKSGTYGWTESFYLVRPNLTVARTRMEAYVQSRLQVLNRDSYVESLRVSNINVRNDSQVSFYTQSAGRGTFGNAAEGEQPYDGLLFRLTSGDLTRRMFIMRGIPRGQITPEGVFAPTDAFRRRLTTDLIPNLIGRLEFEGNDDPLSIRRRTTGDLYAITALAAVTGNPRSILVTAAGELWPPEPGSLIRVTQVDSMARVNRIWKVRAVQTQQVATFPRRQRVIGTYEGGGLVGIMGVAMVNITGAIPEKGVRRDTGRPSGTPRGRRSRGNL